MRHLPHPAFLSLAALALPFLHPASPPGARAMPGDDPPSAPRTFGELEEALRDRDPGKRRRAVRDLALLDSREAWTLVVEHLGDDHGEVADQAQHSLATLSDPRLVGRLLKKDGLQSKDELVRRRVGEALGRMAGPFDGKDLLRGVSRSDPVLSELLLWSIERLALREQLAGETGKLAKELRQLAGRRGPGQVRAQALCASVSIEPGEALASIRGAAADRDPLLRVAALECAPALGEGAELELARRLVSDPSPSVRLAALEALAAVGTREAIEPLIERLEGEERLRLRLRALEFLQDLSGMKYRGDPRPWRLWLSKLPDDWTPRRGGATTESGGTVAFAGLPILSDRISFLIDFSGSLWYEREGRPPRKLKVDELLREALPRLSEETEFNLIPYTVEPHPWRPVLVPATRRNVQAALEDFEKTTVRGQGNVFDAALLALEDPRVDRLIVFTDGAPTGGSHWKLELLVPLLVQAARFRRVAVDSIVVDAPPRLTRHWTRLAELTGGRSIRIEL